MQEKSKTKNRNMKEFIPYRDSKLTSILKNALGGNSITLMICAISPAWEHYEQTLSTLKYADDVKKIVNKPIRYESEINRLKRKHDEEI